MRDSSKLIIRNSVFLYIRMFVVMAVGFFTSRVILQTLGEVDFGLYNVVGGIVLLLSFITSTLDSASARFITYSLGKNDLEETRQVFRSVFTIHLMMAAVILVLFETIGLWLFSQLNIPPDRTTVCMWVYQYSVLATCIGFTSIPFRSSIIAHERMSFYAYLSIYEVAMKLLILYVLLLLPFDKLWSYGTLMFMISLFGTIINVTYCYRSFSETSVRLLFSKEHFKPIFRFTGWTLMESFAYICTWQGSNYLLNVFCGPAVNAARAIAIQVKSILSRFTHGFNTALNPQITKSYAQGDLPYMHTLIINASRYNFFVLFVSSMPIYFVLTRLLELWLVTVPDYTVAFVQVLLIGNILDGMINPLVVAVNATANLRLTQTMQTIIHGIAFTLQWILLYLGYNPIWVFIVYYLCLFVGYIFRLLIIRRLIALSLRQYFYKIIIPVALISSVSLMSYAILQLFLPEQTLVHVCLGFFCAIIPVWFLGINGDEKAMLKEYVLRHRR